MQKAIELSNINLISKTSKYILKNVNLDINEKDCVVIYGPNGMGKTSLLKIICGLIKQTSGTIKIFGNNTNISFKKLIGYIPQTNNFELNLPISVRQVIEIGITARQGFLKRISKQDKSFVEDIAKKLNIFDLLDTPIGYISGGQMQKVSIARVLVQQSKIIMLDEPLSNLDKKSQTDLIQIIEDIHKKQNITILFISHNLELLPKCCNKIFKLPDNKLEDWMIRRVATRPPRDRGLE